MAAEPGETDDGGFAHVRVRVACCLRERSDRDVGGGRGECLRGAGRTSHEVAALAALAARMPNGGGQPSEAAALNAAAWVTLPLPRNRGYPSLIPNDVNMSGYATTEFNSTVSGS
jgi:hypothetical protein